MYIYIFTHRYVKIGAGIDFGKYVLQSNHAELKKSKVSCFLSGARSRAPFLYVGKFGGLWRVIALANLSLFVPIHGLDPNASECHQSELDA